MKDYIEERAIAIANYIIEHNATVRQTAKQFGVSKSTVHKDVTDRLIEVANEGKYRFMRVNFPNGDMVGHTGNYLATVVSVEALDLQLARILEVVDKLGGVALITADHGNADEMCEIDKKTGEPKLDKEGNMKSKTSHTLNPVPCIIYDNTDAKNSYTVKADEGKFGLSNVAATMVNLLGYEAPDMWDESIIEIK